MCRWMPRTSLATALLRAQGGAKGRVVVIDVCRASSAAAVSFPGAVEEIIMTRDSTDARATECRREWACDGEGRGVTGCGVGLANSPLELSQADLAGKRLIQGRGQVRARKAWLR